MKKFLLKKEKKIKNNTIKKYKKKKNNNKLFNILIKSKNMFGDYFFKIKKEIIPFIYGIRYNYNIINLNITSLYLKRIFFLIKIFILKKKKILIIGNSNDIKFLCNKNFIKKNKYIYYFNKEWVNGLITNKIFLLKKFKLIIIIKSTINEIFLYKELYILKIPIISLINTSQNIKNINYPLICNLKNIKSIYILMFLIRKNFLLNVKK